jgi:N-formylglutamate amidohydrolase
LAVLDLRPLFCHVRQMDSSALPSAALAVHRPDAATQVVVSVPHAGRLYPPKILDAARVGQDDLERLEDRWCDRIAARATAAGATVVEACWARAVADCNRGEGQMAPSEVAPTMRAQFSAPGRKERVGLGVVPTRLADCGALWKRPIDRAAFDWRLEQFHRPYHAALAAELAAARRRFGHAVLIDLHSMPPLPFGQPGHGARIVVGDRFGKTAGGWLVDVVVDAARGLKVPISLNLPYAGGHIVRTHGRPSDGIHAVQIEIDRSLYLAAERQPDMRRCADLARWFAGLVTAAVQAFPDPGALPQAAE